MCLLSSADTMLNKCRLTENLTITQVTRAAYKSLCMLLMPPAGLAELADSVRRVMVQTEGRLRMPNAD